MGDTRGFLKTARHKPGYRSVHERIKDYRDVCLPRTHERSREQASRCMDCGTPFCHWGCPIGNYIPEWNDLAFRGQWKKAAQLLCATNTFPEFTGRLCPALCEYACVLGINDDPVTIRENELAIIEYAFKTGLILPNPPQQRSGKHVAVIGSGPAGLACADRLNKLGHNVCVFEKDDKIGGILRYGIPDFKLEKALIDRRLGILEKEGIEFRTRVNVGVNLETAKLLKESDAVCLTCGSREPRDLKIEGRDLAGIYFAMDYLMQSNRRTAGEKIPAGKIIDAKSKRVVVIGGGDTGADCVGTANRQGAKSVLQIEVLPKPPELRPEDCPWPRYPLLLKTSSSHEEGCERKWSVLTKRFVGTNGRVNKLSCVNLESPGKEIPGSEFEIDADMVTLAVGFLHPEHGGPIKDLGVALNERGNVKTDKNYMTSVKGVFSAGDMHRGQSLVVWAISEGMEAARFIDEFLTWKNVKRVVQ